MGMRWDGLIARAFQRRSSWQPRQGSASGFMARFKPPAACATPPHPHTTVFADEERGCGEGLSPSWDMLPGSPQSLAPSHCICSISGCPVGRDLPLLEGGVVEGLHQGPSLGLLTPFLTQACLGLGALGKVSHARGEGFLLGQRPTPFWDPGASVRSLLVVSVTDTQAARQSYGVWLGGYFV